MAITTSSMLSELFTKKFTKGKYKRPKLRKPKSSRRKRKKK